MTLGVTPESFWRQAKSHSGHWALECLQSILLQESTVSSFNQSPTRGLHSHGDILNPCWPFSCPMRGAGDWGIESHNGFQWIACIAQTLTPCTPYLPGSRVCRSRGGSISHAFPRLSLAESGGVSPKRSARPATPPQRNTPLQSVQRSCE